MKLDDVVCDGWKVWVDTGEEWVCWTIHKDDWSAFEFAEDIGGVVTKATKTKEHLPFKGL